MSAMNEWMNDGWMDGWMDGFLCLPMDVEGRYINT